LCLLLDRVEVIETFMIALEFSLNEVFEMFCNPT